MFGATCPSCGDVSSNNSLNMRFPSETNVIYKLIEPYVSLILSSIMFDILGKDKYP